MKVIVDYLSSLKQTLYASEDCFTTLRRKPCAYTLVGT